MNQYPSPSPVPSPGEPIDTPVDPISTFTIKPVKPFSTPSGIAPINNVQYGGHSSVNDSLTPNDDYVWEVNTEKWRKWEDSWQDNAETAGEEPNLSQTEKEVHFTGLVAYVTADLSPESAEASRKIFGKTSTPYTGDSYSNLIVGRALCSLAGYTGNPVGFIRERGETALGLAMPTQGYSTENQLYTLIGSTFAKNERDALTKRQQEQQSRIQAAQKQHEEVLPGALTAIATSNAVTPLQRKVLDESGISGLTVTRIRQLTQQSGVVTTQENATLASDASLKSVRLLGLEHNDSLKGFSLFNTKGLWEATITIGDDPIARAFYLNMMRIAGRNHRDSHHSDSFFGNLGAATGNLLLSTTRGVSEPFIKGGMDAGISAAALFSEEDNLNYMRYQALRADAEAAFQQGYQERSEELANNYGSSILWQISDFPTTIAPVISTTVSHLNPYTASAYYIGSYADNRYQARANSMREGDYSTDIMEHALVPAFKTGTEAAANIAVGKGSDFLFKGLLGKTGIGKAFASQMAKSPAFAYTSRVLEGSISEVGEEAVQAILDEGVEAVFAKDRQKEENWEDFKKTFFDSEFWAGNVAMNVIFGGFGYKGSRSKYPYKGIFKDLGFTSEEQKALQDDLISAQQAGATPQQMGDIVKEHMLKKESASPEEFKQKAAGVMANAHQQQLIQEAAANGVRDAIIKQANISDMVKDADGNIKLKRLVRGEDGKFEMVEETYTEDQLNSWLASNVESTLTQEIIDTQRAVRGEKVSRAVESAKNTPFSRVISMLNAPAELIAKMKDKSSFDEEAMQMFAEFALEEINSRISSGQSVEEARNAEFGTTGASLGSVANLASDFAKRVSLARKQGDLKEDEIAQSNAFILPGRTPGDNILMIARGEASAKDVAHDWLEVFGRSRFHTNPSYWRAALDALDADLLNNGIIQKSLFDNAQGHRDDLEYIEAFSHLAEAEWLATHDIYSVSDNTHNILDEVMGDLGAVQGGLEAAKILKNYLASDAAKAAIGSAIDPLRDVLTKAGATLTDILTTAQESAPKGAADFVLRQRGYIQESTAQDLKALGQEADSPSPLNTTTVDPQQEALPPEAADGTAVTVADLAQMNGIDPQTGSVPAPPNATYSRKDPKKSGKNLIGGIAHGQPDGSIVGAAKLSDISLHPSIGKVDPALVRNNPNEKEVILFRKKDGTLQAIGGFSFLNHASTCGVENVPVRVYPSDKNHTPQWAAKVAMESKIRANLATTADILSHITKNGLNRDKARRQNLIPKDSNGQELPSSRAAWLLSKHATKKTISDTISGKLNTTQALETIADKSSKLLMEARQLNLPGSPTSSFSIIGKKAKTWDKYVDKAFEGRKDGLMRAEIDTSQSKLLLPTYSENEDVYNEKSYYLSDILEYSELYEAYPQLKDLVVTFTDLGEQFDALYYDAENFGTARIEFNSRFASKGDRFTKSTLLHEIQHAIQEIEGFDRGFTSYTDDYFDHNAYMQNEGELEALNVERRMDMSIHGRANSHFYSTIDQQSSSFSVTSNQAQSAFNKDGILEASNAIVTKPGASFSITALHASPHNFRKFSTDKMGSGEGAQAYGWGLYFATSPVINKYYFQYFSDASSQKKLYLGDTPLTTTELEKIVYDTLRKHGGEELVKDMGEALVFSIIKEGAQKQLDDYIDFLKDYEEDVPGTLDAIRELASMSIENKRMPITPSNYRVELNVDDNNLLMWDDYHGGIFKDAKKARILLDDGMFNDPESLLNNMDGYLYSRKNESYDKERDALDETDENAINAFIDKWILYAANERMTGEAIYNRLLEHYSPERASKWLAEQGIKGIKYLDGNSRSAGEGTYNYVVFDGNDIKITEVNESGEWSMEEGWQSYTDTTSSFSISSAKKSTNVFQDMVNEKAREMSRNFVELNAVTAKDPYARAYMTNVMKSAGTSDAEIDALFAIMDGIVKSVQKMEGDFPVMAEWNKRQPDRHEISTRNKNAQLPAFVEKGKALVPKSSAMKKNGDYIFNIDLGTLCAKREPLDWLLQIMAQEKLLSNLGTIQIERLKDLLKSEGLATACDVCFVEAKRYRMLQDSVKTSFYWNAVCHAVGITDDNKVGSPRELSEEQVKILQEMADNNNFKEAFKKYIDENTQRVEDYDLGLTPNMMNKLAKLFLQDPSLMGELNPHRLMTTAGVDELMRTYAGHTDLPSFLAGIYGSSTAKPLEGFNVYDAMSWLKSFDDKDLAKNMAKIYALGGGRAQSFTDFSPVLFIDYVQMFLDFQARNLPLHVYTKVPAFVKLFGRTGTMINMSFVPEMVEGVDADHAGLKKDENGKWVYAWSKDSFPIEEAYKLRNRKDFGGRVGIIAVGVSDAHILKMLNDPRIDMIIPYHASGMPVLVKNKTGLRYATDYTDVQTTKPREGGDREATWSYNEALKRLKDPRKAAAEYLQYCKENNFIPKFEQFSNHKNYYKLLEDFRGYDNNGNAVLQGAVRLRLPRNWRKELRAALSDRQELQGKFKELKGKEDFLKKARDILRYQPLDGKVREVMMERLKSALPGKNSVQSLKRNEFLDKLEEKLAEEGSVESAKARVEVYRKGDGIVYGFAYGDTIYLNEDATNANAPAHEFTHIWAKVAQHANSTLWKEGVNLLKKTKEWNKVLTDNLYESIRNDDNAVASEVLARLVGKENEAFVRMLVDPDGKPLEKKGIIAKVFEWMREMWNNIRSIFDAPGGKPLTLKEFSRIPLKDLWDETRNKQFNEYARIALNKDISQIRTEMQAAHDEAKAAYNPDEDTEPASFSITAATPRRKYMPLKEAVKMEQYVAMAEYARKLRRDSRNIALSDNKNRLDDAAEAAIHLRSLLNAVFATLPKEAQPWKALQHAKRNIDALTWAVANPAADLNSKIAPNLTEEEISQYNSINWKKRREWLTKKLNRLTDSVAESAARSIEAHACRVLLQAAEAAAKSLDPKEQPSGKERRGVTSSSVFKQARDFFKMFTWDVGQRADALTAASDKLNDPNISEEDYEKAVRDRNAILTFAGLYKESLPRVKAGVEAFLKFLQTGKDQWNDKLREERRAIEAIQLAIAKLQPETNHTKTTAKEIKERGRLGRVLVSSLNPVQSLKILANLPGEAGKTFAEIRKNLALAQDAKTHAIDQAHNDAERALDAILGVEGKSKTARDMARAEFLTKANELKKTGIVREGRIKVTTFEFTREEIENLVNVRKALGEEAFIAAIDKHRKKASKEDLLNEAIPYNEVLNDALSQISSHEYRGGKVYVEHYGKRDSHHVEELELTRLQAANLWLLAQQPSYSNKYDQDGNLIERGMLDILGYTDAVIDQLEAYCGKQLIEYALWKREYLNTTGLFEAYEEYMGLPFPKEENYWPGAFDTPAANGSFDAFNTTFEGSGVYGMLIKRKKHVNEPNTAVDMEAAWEHAISQHFHYIHLSPLTRQIRAITRDTDTRNRVRQMVGGTILDNLSVGVNSLDGAPAMQLQASMQANSFFSRIFGNLAKALLNMATSVGIKQISAFGHALAHPLINWVNVAPKLITSLLSEIKGVKIGAITPSEIRKLKSFQIRTNRTNLTKRASHLKPGETQGKLALIEILGGKMLEYSDYWANSIAMAAVYNTEYARAKKLMLETSGTRTLTPEQEAELRQHCENTISEILKQTAQPLEREDKPAFLQQQNWAQTANAFMLGEVLSKIACATSIYKAERAKAYGQSDLEKRKSLFRAIFKTYKYIGGMSLASQGILALLCFAVGSAPDTDDEEFDEWFISQLLAGTLCFGYATAVPLLGDLVAAGGQSIFGQYGAFATYGSAGIGVSYNDIQNIKKAFNTDKGAAERIYSGSNTLRWATALLNFTLGGTKYGNFVADLFNVANNASNAVRPGLQYAKNAEKKSTKTKKSTLKKLQSAKKAAAKSRYTKKVHKPSVDY